MTLLEENKRLQAEVEKQQKELIHLRAVQLGFAPETLPYPQPEYGSDEVDASMVRLYRERRFEHDNGLTVGLKATVACYERWYEEVCAENKALKDELRRVSDEYADASTYLEAYAKENPILCDKVEELEAKVKQLETMSNLSDQWPDWTLYRGDEITTPRNGEKVVLWAPGVFEIATAVVDARVFTTDYNHPASHRPYWRFQDGSEASMQSYVDMWAPIPEYKA